MAAMREAPATPATGAKRSGGNRDACGLVFVHAIVALGAGQMKALAFVAAMLAGMLVFEFAERAGAGDGMVAQEEADASQ